MFRPGCRGAITTLCGWHLSRCCALPHCLVRSVEMCGRLGKKGTHTQTQGDIATLKEEEENKQSRSNNKTSSLPFVVFCFFVFFVSMFLGNLDRASRRYPFPVTSRDTSSRLYLCRAWSKRRPHPSCLILHVCSHGPCVQRRPGAPRMQALGVEDRPLRHT